MAQVTQLSSTGASTPIVLNPVAKSTTVILTATSGSSVSVVQLEVSLDDPTAPGGTAATWALLSSAAAMGSSTFITAAGALMYTVLSPIGMVRITSSNVVASSAAFTLKALQSVTA